MMGKDLDPEPVAVPEDGGHFYRYDTGRGGYVCALCGHYTTMTPLPRQDCPENDPAVPIVRNGRVRIP